MRVPSKLDVHEAANGIVTSNRNSDLPMTQLGVTRLLAFKLSDLGFSMPQHINEFNDAVNFILNESNQFVSTDAYVTVGDLKQKLANLHDDMPVLVERAGPGWAESANLKMDLERHEITEDMAPAAVNEVPRDALRHSQAGQPMYADEITCLRAFGATMLKNKDDREAFVVYLSY